MKEIANGKIWGATKLNSRRVRDLLKLPTEQKQSQIAQTLVTFLRTKGIMATVNIPFYEQVEIYNRNSLDKEQQSFLDDLTNNFSEIKAIDDTKQQHDMLYGYYRGWRKDIDSFVMISRRKMRGE